MSNRIIMSIAMALICSMAIAQTYRCTRAEKEVFDQYPDEILHRTNYRTDEECVRLNARYYIPADKQALIRQYVSNREFHKVCLEFLLPDSLQQRVKRKIGLDEHYQDSIDMVLIPEYGNKISGDNISYALHSRKYIKLDDAQYDYMLAKALDMAHRIRRNRTLNVWNEEMEIIRKTLSKEQLYKFFRNKNSAKVTKEARQAWKRICEAGLDTQLDSVKDMSLAISYFNERQRIKDIYRYYGTSQKKYLAELSRHMPPMIKMLDSLDKKARMEEQEKKNGTVGKDFIW